MGVQSIEYDLKHTKKGSLQAILLSTQTFTRTITTSSRSPGVRTRSARCIRQITHFPSGGQTCCRSVKTATMSSMRHRSYIYIYMKWQGKGGNKEKK